MEHQNKKIACFVSDGFEDIEFITPCDIWNRLGIKMDFYSIDNKSEALSSNELFKLTNLKKLSDYHDNYDVVFVPGGPNYLRTIENKEFLNFLSKLKPTFFAAICAGPLVLYKANLFHNIEYTISGERYELISGNKFVPKNAVISKNIITGRGPGSSVPFALLVARQIADHSKIDNLVQRSFFKEECE